jgi:aspartate ammonia-lyase
MNASTQTQYRVELDGSGPIDVHTDRLRGAQTQRASAHFRIGTERMPPPLIHALVQVKRAAVKVNVMLGLLSESKANAIITAADEVKGAGLLWHREVRPNSLVRCHITDPGVRVLWQRGTASLRAEQQ